jgi:hypothetical protein
MEDNRLVRKSVKSGSPKEAATDVSTKNNLSYKLVYCPKLWM